MGKRKAVTDGPFAEANDVVSGYRLILAKDLNEAAELSKGCPILVVDGQVEVRPVMKLSVMELSEHLFRHEAGRRVATLTRIFGVHNLALAEDVVQDAFCRALEIWKFRGVPENHSPGATFYRRTHRSLVGRLRRKVSSATGRVERVGE